MAFKHDYTGVTEFGQGFDPIPEGDYDLTIIKAEEKKTKSGDNMVNITTEVVGGEYEGRKVFHNVVFLPKDHRAAGMSKHFLKVIGQPFEGVVEVDPEAWEGAEFRAHVKIVDYKGKLKNEIDEVYSPEENGETPSGDPTGKADDPSDEVPF